MCIESNKLEAMVDSLVGSYMATVFDFRVLEPMLYHQNVVSKHAIGGRGPGFASIRFGLYYHVIQQCWKLGCDTDKRSFSATRIFSALEPVTIARLRQQYGDLRISIDPSVDPETRKLFELMNRSDTDERQSEFDRRLEELKLLWREFKSSSYYYAIDDARKKVAAHSEVSQFGEVFRAKDLSDVGIKWGDERLFIDKLRGIVDLLNHLVRRASFDWSRFDEQTERDARNYWK